MKTGIDLIKKERQRQIEATDGNMARDTQYMNGELFKAACCYYGIHRSRAINEDQDYFPEDSWPWDKKWWKPTPDNRVRELEKAGALFMAHNESRGKDPYDEWVEMCAKDIDKILAKP